MGHHDQSDVFFLVQFLQQLRQVFGPGLIERAGGFVRQQQFGLIDQRADHGRSLAFPAGKLAGPVMQARFQAHPVEQTFRPLPRRRRIQSRWIGQGGNQDVLQNGALRAADGEAGR